MRVYVISRSLKGIVRCMVRQINGGENVGGPYRLRHANLHSPTGFECGYGGRGPADLAASILADFFNVGTRAVGAAWRRKRLRPPRPNVESVVHLHQDFKAEIIAGIKLGRGESIELTGDQIAAWLAKHASAETEKAAGA